MAAPHVSGAGAQLLVNERSRDETTQQLIETAEDIGLSTTEAGAGLLDVAAVLFISPLKTIYNTYNNLGRIDGACRLPPSTYVTYSVYPLKL
ncbi:hypothetical protein DMJ13_23290 [halophilic archaeon]|nr:hypothetical protein DMJ13_23290 [halophilic archaeon]